MANRIMVHMPNLPLLLMALTARQHLQLEVTHSSNSSIVPLMANRLQVSYYTHWRGCAEPSHTLICKCCQSDNSFYFSPPCSWLSCCPIIYTKLFPVNPGLWDQWIWHCSFCCYSSCFSVLWWSVCLYSPDCLPWVWSTSCSNCTTGVCVHLFM